MLKLPTLVTGPALADWIEASLLAAHGDGISRITDTAIVDVLAEADFADPDIYLESIIQTVRLRRNAISQLYPIARSGLGFSLRGDWVNHLVYSFMLLTSLNQIYGELAFREGTANRPAELFEDLTALAIRKYLNCDVLRIGAPRRLPIPAAFPAALDYIAAEINEAIGQRDLEDHSSGDDGVDLVAWVSFKDQREGQALLFAQCSIGTDWRNKRDGVSLDLWRRHIDWHAGPLPLKSFAVPFHHERSSWRETSTRAGIVLDRLRIAKLVPNRSLANSFRQKLTQWSRQRLRAVGGLAIEA